MAKPICIIKYDEEAIAMGNGGKVSTVEVNEAFKIKFADYLTFAYPTRLENDLFKFEVFYEKDFTKLQYWELEEKISDAIKELKTLNQ